jgi:hypothetical protein
MKDVNDEVHEVEQHPPALLEPFGMVHSHSFFL